MTLEEITEDQKIQILKFIVNFCGYGVSMVDLVLYKSNYGILDIGKCKETSSKIPSYILENFITNMAIDDIFIILKYKLYDERSLIKLLIKHKDSLVNYHHRPYFGYDGLNSVTEMNFLIEWNDDKYAADIIYKHGFCTNKALEAIRRAVSRHGRDGAEAREVLCTRMNEEKRLEWKDFSRVKKIPHLAYEITNIPESLLDKLSDEEIDWDSLSLYQDVPFKYLKSKLHLLDINRLLFNKYLSEDKKDYLKELLQ